MSHNTHTVILYRYDASPYSVKIDNILTLKNVPHQRVNVASILPRPEITDLLGISYRRIPILAIGNDVYCDTSLIVSALERRFPSSAGFGTVFPPAKHGGATDTGLIKVFSKVYEDTLFPAAVSLLPWEKMPAAFISDRSALRGSPVNIQAIVDSREQSLTMLRCHLSMLEEQFRDGREWLFDSELPSLADVSVHFVLNWAKASRLGKRLINATNFPNTFQWLLRVSSYFERRRTSQTAPPTIAGDPAAAAILSALHEPHDVVGFNTSELEQFNVKYGDSVQVISNDSARIYTTTGRLMAINRDEVVIEVQSSKGKVQCHFPRLGFTIKAKHEHKL